MKAQFEQWILQLLCLILLVSCSTYQAKLQEPRQMLKEGRFSEALVALKNLASQPGDDQLVYLMEYGTGLQMAGQYKESNEIFSKADRLSEQVDYHSVTNLALATLGSEEMVQYKGESYEKLLINANLALNYTMLGQNDEALVEARRINEKVNKIRQEGREDYEQNPFAHYLSGLLWEADGKFDDAYISFERSHKLDPSNPELREDLIRTAKKARREETYKKWKSQFSDVKENPDWYDKNKGEIVVMIAQGWGPKKGMAPENHRIPRLYPVYSHTKNVKVDLMPTSTGAGTDATPVAFSRLATTKSESVYDIEKVAIQTLNADYGWMIARKMGAFAAKEIMADQIRQKNELLGLIAWVGMHASDRADLRQWSTLPQTIQLARFWVKPGTYQLNLQGIDISGAPTADSLEHAPVQVRAGRKTFYFWRPLH